MAKRGEGHQVGCFPPNKQVVFSLCVGRARLSRTASGPFHSIVVRVAVSIHKYFVDEAVGHIKWETTSLQANNFYQSLPKLSTIRSVCLCLYTEYI